MKTKHFLIVVSSLFCLSVIVLSCEKESKSVATKTLDISNEQYVYSATTPETGALGRVLFYDQSLSINNSVSCGTCHKQSLAFSDNKKLSPGFEAQFGDRNTPPIQNLSASGSLFWDGRESSLQTMVMQPIFNHVEMGMGSTSDVVRRVKSKPYYEDLFIKAFGSDEVNFEKISIALRGFVGSISTGESKFERSIASSQVMPGGGLSQVQLSKLEEEGMNLFFGTYDCGSCHDLFSSKGYSFPVGLEMMNIGLDASYQDKGVGALTGNPEDDGKFKVPNLRNVELTGPYMHDGRFATLEVAIDHYSDGIRNHPNLDFRLRDPQTGKPKSFRIPQEDKDALLGFLKTLTDYKMISDPKFSDPFKNI